MREGGSGMLLAFVLRHGKNHANEYISLLKEENILGSTITKAKIPPLQSIKHNCLPFSQRPFITTL